MSKFILNINCPDQKGIIATVTNFIHLNAGNILYIDQYVDRDNKLFFMRLECEFIHNDFTKEHFRSYFEEAVVKKFNLTYELFNQEEKPIMALLVSKYAHCLYDILARYTSNELAVHIPLIISNHNDLKPIAKRFNIPFYHIEVTRDNKAEAEKKQLEILKEHKVETVVLARYMQIVSKPFIENFPNKIINIHHSFLPAFPGAKPYHSAYNRGVKIIGATSHYVTEELDAGPIIAQDITEVSHLHSVNDFIDKGRDLERIVLSKAIQLHINRKVMVYKNKTVIFS